MVIYMFFAHHSFSAYMNFQNSLHSLSLLFRVYFHFHQLLRDLNLQENQGNQEDLNLGKYQLLMKHHISLITEMHNSLIFFSSKIKQINLLIQQIDIFYLQENNAIKKCSLDPVFIMFILYVFQPHLIFQIPYNFHLSILWVFQNILLKVKK